jgi:glycosyltransferase involved in cell wall biosynthesis
VVATPVWGTPEVVATPEAGILASERSVPALIEALRKSFAVNLDRAATRRYAEHFSWDATTEGQLEMFREIVERRAA